MALQILQKPFPPLGDRLLLDGVNLQVEPGECVCLLGRNGAGKPSLLPVVTGDVAPGGGAVVLQRGARLSRLSQEVPGDVDGGAVTGAVGGKTLFLDNVGAGRRKLNIRAFRS